MTTGANSNGVTGQTTAANAGAGVYGQSLATSGTGFGVLGQSKAIQGIGGAFANEATGSVVNNGSGQGSGVYGLTSVTGGAGVYGFGNNSSGIGVYGTATGTSATGVNGMVTTADAIGVLGVNDSKTGSPAYGILGKSLSHRFPRCGGQRYGNDRGRGKWCNDRSLRCLFWLGLLCGLFPRKCECYRQPGVWIRMHFGSEAKAEH